MGRLLKWKASEVLSFVDSSLTSIKNMAKKNCVELEYKNSISVKKRETESSSLVKVTVLLLYCCGNVHYAKFTSYIVLVWSDQ